MVEANLAVDKNSDVVKKGDSSAGQSSRPEEMSDEKKAALQPTLAESKRLALSQAEAPVTGFVVPAVEIAASPKPVNNNGVDKDAAQKAAADPESPNPAVAACPQNKIYATLIDKAVRNVYDPTPFGDLEALKNKHNCEIKTTADAFRFANQELKAAGDRFNQVLPPTEAKTFLNLFEGKSKGFGFEYFPTDPARVATEGPLKVRDVFPDSPAAKAGLKKGDTFVAIDGTDIRTKSFDDASNLLTAEQPQKFTVMRDGKRIELTATPAEVDAPAVDAHMIPGTKIGYVRIRDFIQSDTIDELNVAVKKMPDAQGFVFDLRDNPGGAVDQALYSAAVIVGNGKILTMRNRVEEDGKTPKPEYETQVFTLTKDELVRKDTDAFGKTTVGMRDLRPDDLIDKPTVLLVNGGTASAAEIFTGAVQQNNEGTVIGEQTYGKGIGQTVFRDQPGGSVLEATTFRFFTPNGQWIGDADKNRIGITPNIKVVSPAWFEPEGSTDTQFRTAITEINKKIGAVKKP